MLKKRRIVSTQRWAELEKRGGHGGGVSSKGGTETPGRCLPVETLPIQGSASLGDRCL